MDPEMNGMSRTTLIAIPLVAGLLLAGCAPAAATAPAAPTRTSETQPLVPQVLSSPMASANDSTPTTEVTSTPGLFELNLTPLPTETAIPTLELPTEAPRSPAVQVWDGLPTYPSESRPDYYFRVEFDPDAWALTTDAFGSPALAHRAITSCIISPTQGRGLPPDAAVDHEVRRIGGISYQISTASVNGVKQSVTYAAGDGRIFTAFQVSVEDRPDQCLLEAETVLGTLTSVQVSDATPIATP
jgi:hypothetical protein